MLLVFAATATAQPLPEDIKLTKTCTPQPVRVGEPVTCHITMTNESSFSAINVTVWDELPLNTEFVSVTGTDVDGGAPKGGCFFSQPGPTDPPSAGHAVCRFYLDSTPGGDPIPAGESVSIDVTFIPQEAGTLQNTAYTQWTESGSGGFASFRISTTMDLVVLEAPTTKEECRDGGFASFGFENQGQCVRYVENSKA
jgi:uncharacterized repeat protein (TIGR01451 family)